jgi:hypothetical protein
MSEQKVYPKGISFFLPKENAPSWVQGSLIITPRQLFDWLKENESVLVESEKYGKQLRLQLTNKGVQVDTWKPKSNQNQYKVPTERKTASDFVQKSSGQKNYQADPTEYTDLPF